MNIVKHFQIIETHCFPNKWKIKTVGYKDDNATYLYHKTVESALLWINNFGGTKHKSVKVIKL